MEAEARNRQADAILLSDHRFVKKDNWTHIIKARSGWLNINLHQLWDFRDLILLFVKRDFTAVYKQTILGPLWLFIQPVLTTVTFTIIFQNVARIGTDGIPTTLFYLAGITLWTYFADCLNKTSNTFVANAGIFGKVYFPRLAVPVSVLISNLIKLGIQLLLFIVIWIYFVFFKDVVKPNYLLFLLFPVLVFIMAGLGLGFGILISSLTTKYRDLTFLVGFGVQLMMYASPVVYPLSVVPDKYKMFILANPVSPVIEAFKYIFLGNGFFSWHYLLYSFIFMLALLFVSVIVFSKVEKSFMDTV
jgi:lipopolysaccharide transport system permease protein